MRPGPDADSGGTDLESKVTPYPPQRGRGGGEGGVFILRQTTPKSKQSELLLLVSDLIFSHMVKLGVYVCVCKGGWDHLGHRSGLQHIGEALIWCVRRAAADSPSRDGAVFVLRVCKLAVIRLLSNDVGELIRAVLMGALISL